MPPSAQNTGTSAGSPFSEVSVVPLSPPLKKISVTVDLALPFGQTPAIALCFWLHHIRRSALLSLKLSLSAPLYISIFRDLELSRGTLDHWEQAEW